MTTFPMICETHLPEFGIQGECTLWENIPDNPTNIIRTNETWGVKFKWTTKGNLNYIICGHWHLNCFLEKWGPGEADELPGGKEPCVQENPHTYKHVLTFKPQPEGNYKISARLKLHGITDIPGPLICMAEGPMLDFYVAKFP
jgi:hypothetical protein